MKKGKFIVFEGGEGTGKTTIANKLIKQLKEEGYDVIHTREPGGIDIAEQIREVILNNKNIKMDPKTEALLFAASRRQHLIEKILPALNKGKIVICDRFVHSSLVYQGIARDIGYKEIYDINKFVVEDNFPDLVIYMDLDPIIGLSRIKNRVEKNNRLDNEKLEFHKKVRKGYLDLAKKDKSMIVIDVCRSVDDIYADVYKSIKQLLNKK